MWDCLIRFLCHVLLINIKQIISWIVKFQQKRVNPIKNLLLKMLEKLYAHKNEVDKELLWIIVQIIFNIPDNKERLSVTQPGL